MSAPVELKAITFNSTMEVIWEEGHLAFTWKGGEYIEVRVWHDDATDNKRIDVINVFDYERGAPEISTIGQMEGVIAEWIMAQQAVALLGLE